MVDYLISDADAREDGLAPEDRDMADQTAPERVWRVKPWIASDNQHGLASWPKPEQAGEGAAEYVRVDLVRDELQAAVAAALEDAARWCEAHHDATDTQYHERLLDCAEDIRASITPEQSAALDRVKAEARKDGMLRAAEIAHDHKGLQPASGCGQDEADGYQNGQVDIQTAIAAAIRAGAGKP